MLSGTIEFNQTLIDLAKKIEPKLRTKILRQSLAKAKPVLTSALQSAAPTETGAMRAAVEGIQKNYKGGGVSVLIVGIKPGVFEVTLPDGTTVEREPYSYVFYVDAETKFIRSAFESAHNLVDGLVIDSLIAGITKAIDESSK